MAIVWKAIRPCLKVLNVVNLPVVHTNRLIVCRTVTISATAMNNSIPAPALDNEAKTYKPKLVNLVDSISQLTLREVADLNELLKSTLNIKDAPMVAQVAAPAAADVDEADAVPEKTEFVVKLLEFAAADKIKLIKAIKSIKDNFNLVQAKKFVESLPQVVKDDVSKDEADELKKTLEDAGGKVDIV